MDVRNVRALAAFPPFQNIWVRPKRSNKEKMGVNCDRAFAALSPFLTSDWLGWAGMGWLRTARSGVPFVTASSPLFDRLCLAALTTGIPLVGALPAILSCSLF
eukprot:212950-Chlamydomonas_euryale.AAC.1